MAQSSSHPPLCPRGHRAEEWVCEHHIDETPFGPHSPFAKLSEQDGLVVGLGVLPENCLTHVHVFEDRMGKNFPFSLYEENLFQVSMIDHSGVLSVFRTPLHNTLSGTRDIRILTRALAKSNAVTYRNFLMPRVLASVPAKSMKRWKRCIGAE
ncbi:MAG: AAC(3) family N-acetyltransferase [candidate division Zixibacteria bacterium]|nr:AAC(3) family N-acetyltransferase [candidate division Zixibacteria bacterium]